MMWRLIPLLVVLGLCNTVFAQPLIPPTELPNLGQAIGIGASKSVADLEARIDVLVKLVPNYEPTWTWPGHKTAERIERLREHLQKGEAIHKGRDVARWSSAELAFVHDCDHVEEYLKEGKALPELKDQRLRDWVRAKNPAKALPKKIATSVRKLVLHKYKSGKRCDWCDKTEKETLPAARADGVEVSVIADLGDFETGPQIEVCTDTTCRRVLGYVAWSTIKAMSN